MTEFCLVRPLFVLWRKRKAADGEATLQLLQLFDSVATTLGPSRFKCAHTTAIDILGNWLTNIEMNSRLLINTKSHQFDYSKPHEPMPKSSTCNRCNYSSQNLRIHDVSLSHSFASALLTNNIPHQFRSLSSQNSNKSPTAEKPAHNPENASILIHILHFH